MRLIRALLKNYIPALVIVVLLMMGWQFYTSSSGISSSVLPSPLKVWSVLVENWPVLWDNAAQTLLETLWGFSIALLGGFVFAALLDNSPVAKRAVYPLLVVSQTVPLVAIAPLLIVWFGFDITPKIIIVWLVCFFPITVGGVDGFNSVDPDTARLFKAMGANRWQIFWKLRVPSALPNLFSGIRIAVTYSIAGAILGEYAGAEKGLGRLISLYSRAFNRDMVFAVVFLTAALSFLLFVGVSLVQHRVMPWYFAMRQHKS